MKHYYEQAETSAATTSSTVSTTRRSTGCLPNSHSAHGPVQLDPQRSTRFAPISMLPCATSPISGTSSARPSCGSTSCSRRGDLATEVSKNRRLRRSAPSDQQEWMWSSVYDQAQFVLSKYATKVELAAERGGGKVGAHGPIGRAQRPARWRVGAGRQYGARTVEAASPSATRSRRTTGSRTTSRGKPRSRR